MNHKLRRLAISNRTILRLINAMYNLKNRDAFQKRIEENKQLTIFDYQQLIKDIPYAPSDLVIDNNLYGLSYTLKQYAGLNVEKSLDATIEHGVFFGNLVRKDDQIYPVDTIVTYGNRRAQHLQKANINKRIVQIGPYIHYAQPLLPAVEFEKLKKELGRVLLIFPSHGIIGTSAAYNVRDFISEIERVRKDFDTVLVSLYWTDAMKPQIVSQYEQKGYKIVTSGHRFDVNFLSRQRSIIELADYTMSNNLGTHVGYCVHLGKPHYIYRQNVDYSYRDKKVEKHVESSRTEDNMRTYLCELEEVCSFFDQDVRAISTAQREVVDEFWGVSQIKAPEELKRVLHVIS